MKRVLVVDTNVLFSFFRENPVRLIIVNAKLFGLKLYTPEYAFEELWANKADLARYSKLKEKELEQTVKQLRSFIEVAEARTFKEFKAMSKIISPDEKDAPFFAVALKLNADIWSNEPRLKRQSVVQVFSTADLIKELSKFFSWENSFHGRKLK